MAETYYRWHPGRDASRLRALTCEEEGFYRRLVDHTFYRGWLPNDLRYLARVANVDPRVARRLWPRVSHLFTPDGDGWNVDLEGRRVATGGEPRSWTRTEDARESA